MITARGPRAAAKVTARDLGRAAGWGAGAGLVASVVMAMYAMFAAATYQRTGFFTPMYHIASTVVAPDAMMTSMLQATAGHPFTFAPGPALLGELLHMTVGAIYGAVFGVLIRVARVSGLTVLIAGLVWGVIVFVVSSWVGLPIAAAVFDAGYPIRNMVALVGYPTFVIEHLIFGATLGVLLMHARLARR
ncbi:hypothetical protein [Mycobacterium riyadhense]|uniref:DUF1440 domain-containing protein n=1 Tax=Mycobacterium riyadhense TaxID=486698 RepID=A0A653EEA3_9MYCO|nr:hypothetical protein [Mycobacterium riyadhense]VTO94941.1 hypothetical protein BIN_B_00415 [Mycobacterium riyadhense]